MPLSPQDIEKLRLGVQNRCRPRVRGIEFEFRPLTIAEQVEVTTQSVTAFSKMLPDQKHTINESQIIAICTLVKASELQRGQPGVTEDTLRMLTADELGYLFKEWTEMSASCDPAIETIPIEELQRLAEELKKNPSTLIDCSFLQRINLLRYLLTKDSLPRE